jgi:ATPase subunit of ABC transporter with duplicated ATPase domains
MEGLLDPDRGTGSVMANEPLERIQQAFDEWRAAEAAYQVQVAKYAAFVSRVDDQALPGLDVEAIHKRAKGRLSELRATADAAQMRFEELSDGGHRRPWRA